MSVRFDDPDRLGPIRTQAFRRDALGYVEREGGSIWVLLLGFARRALLSYATGRWRRTPSTVGGGPR